MSDQKLRKRAFFSSSPSQKAPESSLRERILLPSIFTVSSMVQRVLLKKNTLAPITSHRLLVYLPPFSPSEFEEKKASNYAVDATTQRFRCRQSKHTVLRDTSPRGNSALIEDFGSNSCRCIWMWRRAITTLPLRERKHDGDEVLVAHHDSAAGTLHTPRVQPRATALARP